MTSGLQKILESKADYRRKLAALPIGEKLTLLDAMRERAVANRHATSKSGSNLLREDPVLYASSKVIAKARGAGLEPIASNPADIPKQA